jgi:hypothetical protein
MPYCQSGSSLLEKLCAALAPPQLFRQLTLSVITLTLSVAPVDMCDRQLTLENSF